MKKPNIKDYPQKDCFRYFEDLRKWETKNSCSEHKKEIAGIPDMKQLAEFIGDLHYESLAKLLNALAEKLQADYVKDNEAGRVELAKCLLWMYHGINKASYGAEKAWQISKPFMLNSGQNDERSVAREAK